MPALLRQSSADQLNRWVDFIHKTIGKDIGEETAHIGAESAKLVAIRNPITPKIDTYEKFLKGDNKLQTRAFKSKYVNRTLIKGKGKKLKESVDDSEWHKYPEKEEKIAKVNSIFTQILSNILHKRRTSKTNPWTFKGVTLMKSVYEMFEIEVNYFEQEISIEFKPTYHKYHGQFDSAVRTVFEYFQSIGVCEKDDIGDWICKFKDDNYKNILKANLEDFKKFADAFKFGI